MIYKIRNIDSLDLLHKIQARLKGLEFFDEEVRQAQTIKIIESMTSGTISAINLNKVTNIVKWSDLNKLIPDFYIAVDGVKVYNIQHKEIMMFQFDLLLGAFQEANS